MPSAYSSSTASDHWNRESERHGERADLLDRLAAHQPAYTGEVADAPPPSGLQPLIALTLPATGSYSPERVVWIDPTNAGARRWAVGLQEGQVSYQPHYLTTFFPNHP